MGKRDIKPKKRCCKSGPRCKRCPVVLRRLEAQGFARKEHGRYLLSDKLKKKHMRAARG